jgi:hypothetical protein
MKRQETFSIGYDEEGPRSIFLRCGRNGLDVLTSMTDMQDFRHIFLYGVGQLAKRVASNIAKADEVIRILSHRMARLWCWIDHPSYSDLTPCKKAIVFMRQTIESASITECLSFLQMAHS